MADFKKSAEEKQALLEQAKQLQDSKEWRSTSDKMKNLMTKWKEAGYAGAENESLWNEFIAAQNTFFERQKEHYAELRDQQGKCRSEKERIISQAKEASEGSTDWKGTHTKLEELLKQWKKAGSAGRNEDERLWGEFQAVRNAFYERRSADRENRERGLIENRQKKSALISEVQNYTRAHDYSEDTLNRVKTMIEDWKTIGFCGKQEGEQLWEKFRKAQDAYWCGKKFFS